ncbi:MAG: SMC-Scp complex subunit ScpB [Phycisphaerales bacterium]|nr:SMC-Scp complex subunit ScpB [Phycisphaerales bacterium]
MSDLTQAPAETATDEGAVREVPCGDRPLAQRIEALLMAADRPMSDGKIGDLLGLAAGAGESPARAVREAIDQLNGEYAATGRTIRIESLAGGRQLLTLPAFAPVVSALRGQKQQTRLTQPALETLAIVAYRQPIQRAEIESIRGVACGEVLRSLLERRLVRIVGRAEELGRPMLYGTTAEFLKVFGLGSLADLPQSKELRT